MPATFEALAVIMIAVVPGSLALAAWSRGKTLQGPRSDATMVVQAIGLSLVIQAVLAPATVALLYPFRAHLDRHPFRVVAWGFTAAVVVPLIGGYGLGRLADLLTQRGAAEPNARFARLRRDLRPMPPSTFDWIAGTTGLPDPSLVIITFRDGTRAAGVYAAGAVTTTSPQTQGLFLPAEVILDDEGMPTGESVHNTKGILVPDLTEVRSIRILDI